jgi:hypothetical protein
MRFVEERIASIDRVKPLTILDGFNFGMYSVDCVGVLSPDVAKPFVAECASLGKSTFVAFPMYRCEFTGNEDGETIDMMRHDIVSTLDWRRQPSPVVKMRFRNSLTGVHSTQQQGGYAKLDFLFRQIEEMSGGVESYVEVENYRGNTCRISVTRNGFSLRSDMMGNDATLAGVEEVRSWLLEFVCPMSDA